MWSQSSTVEIQKLLAWFTQQLEKVRDVMPEDTVSDADHSNELTGDIAAVRAKLMQLAQRVVQQRQPH
jgi:methyl-accepting chemotaxis protein